MSPDEDQVARVAQLTEAQLRCVRLISTGSSKHIALKIGISHRTVDQHICAAMLRLGVGDRYAARALVASWDARHPEILPMHTDAVADDGDRIILETPYPTGLFQREAGKVREVSVDYVADLRAVSRGAAVIEECPRHETSGLQTAAKIIGLTLGLVIILSAAEPLGRGFESLASFILHLRN